MIILEKKSRSMAVIYDNDEKREIPLYMAEGCSEGDVIILSGDKYITDTAATEKRKKDIISLQNSLFI